MFSECQKRDPLNQMVVMAYLMSDYLLLATDLRTLTLVGPTRDNPVLDPLAVLHLDNQLYMFNIKILI